MDRVNDEVCLDALEGVSTGVVDWFCTLPHAGSALIQAFGVEFPPEGWSGADDIRCVVDSLVGVVAGSPEAVVGLVLATMVEMLEAREAPAFVVRCLVDDADCLTVQTVPRCEIGGGDRLETDAVVFGMASAEVVASADNVRELAADLVARADEIDAGKGAPT